MFEISCSNVTICGNNKRLVNKRIGYDCVKECLNVAEDVLWTLSLNHSRIFMNICFKRIGIYRPPPLKTTDEGADRVRGRGRRGGGRGEKRGRDEGEEGVGGGEEGEGGGKRGGGRRERGEKGREGKDENFARAKRAPLQKGGGRRGGGRGELRGERGGEAYPLVHPLTDGTRFTEVGHAL